MDEINTLETLVAKGFSMEQFVDTEVGKRFMEHLQERYMNLVQTAIKESPTVSKAATEIESLVSLMGSTITSGEISKKRLEVLFKGQPLDTNEW